MTKGNFRLYYVDDHGQQRPAPKVRYRILEVPAHTQVAVGETDAFGATQTVEATSSLFSVGTVPVTSQTRVPMMPATITRFSLEVWDYALSQWSAPDYARKAKSALPQSMELQLSTTVMITAPVQMAIEVQPYFKLRFIMQADNKPIVNAPYLAYAIDEKGREVAGSDAARKPIKGNTDKAGCTPRIACSGRRRFSFNLPGTKVARSTVMLDPLLKGQKDVIHTLGMKSQVARTASGSGRVANVDGKISAPAVLNAEAQELLLLTPDVWAEFEALSGMIENTMAGLHRSRANLDNALQGRDAAAVAAAEKALGIAEDDVAKMLNRNFGKLADLQELVTFESYDKGRTAGNGSLRDRSGLRRRYIPAGKYEDMRRRRIMGVPIAVKLSASAKVKGHPNADARVGAKHDPLGTKGFNPQEFMESLSKITVQAKKEARTDPYVIDLIEAGGNEFVEHVKKSDSYEVDSAAQWLRFVAGAGASAQANWNPSKGSANAKAEASASAKLVLFEGKWTHSYSVPSIKGWQMQFANMDMGAIVFVLACDLYGFVGAKGTLAGAAEIKYERDKPVATAQPRDRSDSLAENFDTQRGLPRANLDEPRVRMMGLNETQKGSGAGVEVTAEVFVGVEGGITPSGDLRWLPPDRKDPVSFAKIAIDAAGSAGAGAKAQLTIFFGNRKFRIRASARLCWGLGAKGAVDFAVDAGGMLEFVKWVYYQLAHTGFKALTYIAQDAFRALSQIMFMVIAQDTSVGQHLAESFDEVNEAFDDYQGRLERAEARSKMVDDINKKPDWLVYATPETRGMLLYAITRHYAESHARNTPSMDISFGDIQVHALPAHKQAVLNVMLPISTRPEWENVMQHMTKNGLRRADSGKAEGDVVRFLDYGWSLNNDLPAVLKQMNVLSRDKPKDAGNSYLQKYLEKRANLMKEFPRGYSVAQLMSIDDPQQLAALDGTESPTFAMMDPPGLWLERDDEIMLA